MTTYGLLQVWSRAPLAKTTWLEKETAGAEDGLSRFMSASASLEMGAGTFEMHGERVLPCSRMLKAWGNDDQTSRCRDGLLVRSRAVLVQRSEAVLVRRKLAGHGCSQGLTQKVAM